MLAPLRHVHRAALGLFPFASRFIGSALNSSPAFAIIRPDVDGSPKPAISTIQWGPCFHIDNTTQAFNALECGTLVVPLDHDNAPDSNQYNSSNTVVLGMARLTALDPSDPTARCTARPCITTASRAQNRQSLILNPGGPGGIASFSLLRQVELESSSPSASSPSRGMISSALRAKYDLIGLDPRGVGLSQALSCNDTLRDERPDTDIRTEQAYEAMGEWNRRYAESCERMSGGLVRYMNTVSVAKDFELVRQALGEDKLNFLAISYGTQIAAQYINLYPLHVGRFVLDGIVDHTQDALHSSSTDAATFEAALNRYFEWCDATPSCIAQFTPSTSISDRNASRPGYWKGGAPFSTAAIFDMVMSRLAHSPLLAPGCVHPSAACMPHVGLREFTTAMQAGLQMQHPLPCFPTSWLNLTVNLASAYRGDGTPLSPPRTPLPRSSGGSTSLPDSDPAFSAAAATAIFCLDTARLSSFSAFYRQRIGLAALYPHTRGNSNAQTAALHCVGWPWEPSNPPSPLNTTQTEQSAEVVLVQSTVDPSTSVEWALSLKAQLPRSKMVLRDGVGHGSYILGGEAAALVDRYFLDGTLPEENVLVKT